MAIVEAIFPSTRVLDIGRSCLFRLPSAFGHQYTEVRMMRVVRVSFVSSVVAVTLLVACAGGATNPGVNPGCGFPPPLPAPPAPYLIYPAPNATAVPDNAGVLVFGGPSASGPIAIFTSGVSVPIGAFTAAPSPLPSPHATPGAQFSNYPYYAAPIPTLSPASTYTVTSSYQTWADTPPSCTATATQTLGSFTTQ